MSEKLYYLNYCGERICEGITLDNALLMIEALCRKYYKEPSHGFELVEMEQISQKTLSCIDSSIKNLKEAKIPEI